MYNKKGELSFELHCSGKDPFTKKNKVYTKTYKVPPELKGKKEIEEFRLNCQLEWKKEVEKKSKGLFAYSEDVNFYDYALKYVDRILIYNKESYNHYSHCKQDLKVLKEWFGLYTIREITLPIIQHFCDWLCTRTYKKECVIVKKSAKEDILKKMSLKNFAELCGMSTNTLTIAITVGSNIAKETAKKISKSLEVPITQYFDIKSEDVLYSKTANKSLKVLLHGILKQAVKDGIIAVNYASGTYTRTITGTVGTKEIFGTKEEVLEFLQCLDEEPDIRKRIAFSIGICLGLRGAEITGLEWKDIDFENGTISVNRNTLYINGFGIVTKSTKNKSSTRILTMPEHLVAQLKEYQEWWNNEKIHHGDLWAKTDRLFVQNCGKNMSNSTLAGWLKKFEQEHGFKNVTLHGLRHSNITMLITNGVDVRTVASRVGHSDVQTTLNIYSHYTTESDKKASDTLDKLLYS